MADVFSSAQASCSKSGRDLLALQNQCDEEWKTEFFCLPNGGCFIKTVKQSPFLAVYIPTKKFGEVKLTMLDRDMFVQMIFSVISHAFNYVMYLS